MRTSTAECGTAQRHKEGDRRREVRGERGRKKGENKHIYETNRLTDIGNRLVVAEEKGGKDWEFGVSTCKLLYGEWINDKVLLIAQGTIFNIL